ncbi:MAG: N-acetylmuramoyl-L-alanine amidase [Patescibacteria group bacterium]
MRLLLFLAVIFLVTAPTRSSTEVITDRGFLVVDRPVSSGFARGRTAKVDTIVFHSVFAEGTPDPYSVDAVLAVFKRLKVSAHYLIARDGVVYKLVSESNTSYHAGKSRMPAPDGRAKTNSFTIGIELIGGYDDRFTEAQYQGLEQLLLDIRSRHQICQLVAHGEISGDRKTDPWNFDWIRLRGWLENWGPVAHCGGALFILVSGTHCPS